MTRGEILPGQATCPDGHPLFRCRLCELVFEAGLADPLPGGVRRCPQCFMGDSEPLIGEAPADAIIHSSKFT